MPQAAETMTQDDFARMMQRPKERDTGYDPWDDILEGCDWDAYWSARDEADERDPLVLDCGNPDCIMSGYHYRSECITADELAVIYEDPETILRPRGLRPGEKPHYCGGVTWWPVAFVTGERGELR